MAGDNTEELRIADAQPAHSGVNSGDVLPVSVQISSNAGPITADSLLKVLQTADGKYRESFERSNPDLYQTHPGYVVESQFTKETWQQIEALKEHPERLQAINDFVNALKQNDTAKMKLALTPFACDPKELKAIEHPLSVAVGISFTSTTPRYPKGMSTYDLNGSTSDVQRSEDPSTYSINMWRLDQDVREKPMFNFTASKSCTVA